MSDSNKLTFPETVLLSGADCFMLALEQHSSKFSATGNVCHMVLDLQGKLDESTLRSNIEKLNIFNWLSSIKLERGGLGKIPFWKKTAEKNTIEIISLQTDHFELPESIINFHIPLNASCLFRFYLIGRPDENTTLVFSWHHILMDAHGAETLIKYLGEEISLENIDGFFPAAEKEIPFSEQWKKMWISKKFVEETAQTPLAEMMEKSPAYMPDHSYKVITFSEEETLRIDKNAELNGAKFGKGAFNLASAARAVSPLLETKKDGNGAIWIPVPQNKRLKGGYGPVVSNPISFLFYRITKDQLKDLKSCTESLTSQLFHQIKIKAPADYSVMSNLLRRIPSWLYYQMLKGPGGGVVASFLFTDPGATDFKTFMGMTVKDFVSFPPNTFPPGLTIVFQRFNKKQKILINFTKQVISHQELQNLENHFRKDLLG